MHVANLRSQVARALPGGHQHLHIPLRIHRRSSHICSRGHPHTKCTTGLHICMVQKNRTVAKRQHLFQRRQLSRPPHLSPPAAVNNCGTFSRFQAATSTDGCTVSTKWCENSAASAKPARAHHWEFSAMRRADWGTSSTQQNSPHSTQHPALTMQEIFLHGQDSTVTT